MLKAPQADADPKLGDQRLISLDNDDEGAAHLFQLMRDLGVDRQRCVPWNICPFPLPPSRFDPSPEEFERSRPYFDKFMDLIEAPEVVLVLGAAARRGWQQHDFVDLARGCRVVYGPSPSPPGIDNRGALNRLRDAFVDAFEIEI
ncbi:uracil-DNA glycosylase family protein [Gordonia sp. PS3]